MLSSLISCWNTSPRTNTFTCAGVEQDLHKVLRRPSSARRSTSRPFRRYISCKVPRNHATSALQPTSCASSVKYPVHMQGIQLVSRICRNHG